MLVQILHHQSQLPRKVAPFHILNSSHFQPHQCSLHSLVHSWFHATLAGVSVCNLAYSIGTDLGP